MMRFHSTDSLLTIFFPIDTKQVQQFVPIEMLEKKTKIMQASTVNQIWLSTNKL